MVRTLDPSIYMFFDKFLIIISIKVDCFSERHSACTICIKSLTAVSISVVVTLESNTFVMTDCNTIQRSRLTSVECVIDTPYNLIFCQ